MQVTGDLWAPVASGGTSDAVQTDDAVRCDRLRPEQVRGATDRSLEPLKFGDVRRPSRYRDAIRDGEQAAVAGATT